MSRLILAIPTPAENFGSATNLVAGRVLVLRHSRLATELTIAPSRCEFADLL